MHSKVPQEGQGKGEKNQRGSEEHSPEVQYRVQCHIGAVQSSVPYKGSAEGLCPNQGNAEQSAPKKAEKSTTLEGQCRVQCPGWAVHRRQLCLPRNASCNDKLDETEELVCPERPGGAQRGHLVWKKFGTERLV